MNHYFTDNTETAHNRKVHSFRFLGVDYRFMTDSGVFSKGGIDFGTQLLLTALSDQNLGSNVIDLGCGYGPIAIILQKMKQCKMTAIDVNPRAIELTQLNCELNQAEVAVICDDGLNQVEGHFSSIVTNPPIRAGKAVIYRFFREAHQHLEENGCLWVVIRKQQGANSAIHEITSIFGNCSIFMRKKGYFILKAEKEVDVL